MAEEIPMPPFIAALQRSGVPALAHPLAGLDATLRDAVAAKERAGLSRLILAHAAEVERLARTSPLETLREGRVDVPAAIWLASVGDPDQATARLLLLAWHFADHSQADAVTRVVSALTAIPYDSSRPRPAAVAPAAIGSLVAHHPALSTWLAATPADQALSHRAWDSEAAFQELVDRTTRSGSLDEATETITKARFGQDVPERWLEFIEALMDADQLDLAKRAIDELRTSIETLHSSRWIRAQYWPCLARALALIDEVDAAIAAAEDDSTAPHRGEARRGVVTALVERGNSQAALQYARSVVAPAGRYNVLVASATAQAASENNDAARATLVESMVVAIDPIWISTPIAGRLPVAWEIDQPGRRRRGRDTRQTSVEPGTIEEELLQAATIRDAAQRTETLARIATVQATTGDIAGAWTTRNLACETAGITGAAVKRALRATIVQSQAAIVRNALDQMVPIAADLVIATACDAESAEALVDAIDAESG